MDATVTLIVVAIAVVALLVAVGIWAAWAHRRQEKHFQETFGREYDEAYARAANGRTAREELHERESRVGRYHLRPLSSEQRMAFLADWQGMRASFVDHPGTAVTRADMLLSEVMRARGYESNLAGQDQRIADVSVGHGEEASAFREAVRIASLNRQGCASTEDLRRAIKDYGIVFEALLNERQPVA